MNKQYAGLHRFIEWLDNQTSGVHMGALEDLTPEELASLRSFVRLIMPEEASS